MTQVVRIFADTIKWWSLDGWKETIMVKYDVFDSLIEWCCDDITIESDSNLD